ncbi:hypothetical protein LWI28_008714 [Acer negundo]|uniref:Exostosin GT47 domain-containing protein n=1 Tax=Acer negundo TaxID=4023 RepID=A0AAD5NPX5_ACENE|nr:hypothetical protein LWI28_008714 [Acer negundo]KAK4844403.1 hypothetical protein QYF36_019847 [Acer negundo]
MVCKSGMAAFIIFFFFFLMILIESGFSYDIPTGESDCSNRWIHIRRLPSRFNLDLLTNCSEYHIYDNFCPYLLNHGLGTKTHNHSHSWYRTDPYMLELVFHRRMLEYPCLTQDPNLANAIYLPYYAALDALKYLYGPEINSSSEHGLELYSYLRSDAAEIWDRFMGHDHFLVMARPAWDFSQPLNIDPPLWGTSFLELPEFYNVTALVLESRAWSWQEQAVPYPTSFHPSNSHLFESWLKRVRRSRRSILMLFAGGGGIAATPNIRRSIRNECEYNKTDDDGGSANEQICNIVDCSNGICEHDPIRFMKPMLQANFCLQPPGNTPTRRSTFDAIIAGCIPVFFEEQSAISQYGWHLPPELYDEFSVFIPKEDVVFKELKIVDVLQSIPDAKVRKMREKVIELMPRLMYRRHGSTLGLKTTKDAFDIAIDATLERISSRLQDVSFQ